MAKTDVMVEISARHLHISRADLDVLFGADHQLTNKKDLSQPGQFACEEKVTIVGPKGQLKMSILGPERPKTQIEISLTDARSIGISAPVRESGDVSGTPGCKVIGPAGEVDLDEGVMVAKRHIHLSDEDAKEYGIEDKQIVSVKLSGPRSIILNECVCRVSPKFKEAMHIDTDEANAAGVSGSVTGEIIK